MKRSIFTDRVARRGVGVSREHAPGTRVTWFREESARERGLSLCSWMVGLKECRSSNGDL